MSLPFPRDMAINTPCYLSRIILRCTIDMPRIGPLLSLSREHHHSLVLARDARRAADNGDATTVAAAVAHMESHWRTLMAPHFDREERLIRMAEGTLDPESVARILSEHSELRRLAIGPCELEPVARLRKFADLARAHVRYEERVFFPQLHSCVAATDTQANCQVETTSIIQPLL